MRFLYERETNELSPFFCCYLCFFFSLLLQSCMYETGKPGKTKVLTGVRREASISSCEQQRCPLLLLFLLLVSPAFELMMSQNDLSCFFFSLFREQNLKSFISKMVFFSKCTCLSHAEKPTEKREDLGCSAFAAQLRKQGV